MQLKTILNMVQKHKSFVYGEIRLLNEKGGQALEIQVKPRKGSRPICSACGRRASAYDTLPPRQFEFIPLWGFLVFSLLWGFGVNRRFILSLA